MKHSDIGTEFFFGCEGVYRVWEYIVCIGCGSVLRLLVCVCDYPTASLCHRAIVSGV